MVTEAFRPSFTVVWKGTRYDANNLTVAHKDGQYVLLFLCSGGVTTVPVEEVEKVEFSPVGPFWCSVCDERLNTWPYKNAESHTRKIGTDSNEAYAG